MTLTSRCSQSRLLRGVSVFILASQVLFGPVEYVKVCEMYGPGYPFCGGKLAEPETPFRVVPGGTLFNPLGIRNPIDVIVDRYWFGYRGPLPIVYQSNFPGMYISTVPTADCDQRPITGWYLVAAANQIIKDANLPMPSGMAWINQGPFNFSLWGNGVSLVDMTGTIGPDGVYSSKGTGVVFGTVPLQANLGFTPALTPAGAFMFNSALLTIAGQPAVPFTNTYLLNATQTSSQAMKACTFSAYTEDPISTATGEDSNSYDPDLSLGGPLPLEFRRNYSSYAVINGITSALGANWTHNFDIKLAINGTAAKVVLPSGGMIAFTLSAGNWNLSSLGRTPYQLAAGGSNYRFSDPSRGLIYNFNSSGSLLGIQDRNGNALTVSQSTVGPTQITDGLGRTITLTYTGTKLTKVTDQSNRSVVFANDGTNLTAVTDTLGNVTTYQYTSNKATPGLMTSSTRPAGNKPYGQVYDANARVASQVDSFGNRTSLSFNAANVSGANTVTDPLNRTTKYIQSSLMELSSYTDAAGQTGSVAFDTQFRPVTYTDRLGNKTTLTYDRASGQPATVTDALGNKATYSYAAQTQNGFTYYVLAKTVFPDGTSESNTYDPNGNLLTITGRDGKVITNSYNSRGQLLTTTNQAGGVSTYTYNTDATVATLKTPAGDVTTYSYDSLKRPVKRQFADNTTQTVALDALDQPLSFINPRGKTTKSAYDANTNLKSQTGPLNGTNNFVYDGQDRLSKSTDRLGNSTTYEYNTVGTLTSSTNAAGEKVTRTYDLLDRLKTITDPAGKGPSFAYDAEGRLVGLTDAVGAATQFTVDKAGRRTRVTTPLNETFDSTYDTMGRITSSTDALGRKSTASYESRGLLSASTLPGGASTAYTYNDLGLLTSAMDPNGNLWTRDYDKMGRLTSFGDPLAQGTTYAYDSRNRVATATNAATSLTNAFDENGNVVMKQFGDGTTLNFTYDDEDRVTAANSVTLSYDLNGRITASNGLTIKRDTVGRIASIAYAPGPVTYSYDNRGLLTKMTDWVGGATSFTYDDARRMTSITRPNGVTTAYTYDKNGRRVSISETGSNGVLSLVAFQRDALGRVTSADRNVPQLPTASPGVTPLSYDAANQIAGVSYDALGRQTGGIPGATYTWDGASRLSSYARADGAAAFTYDAYGKQLSRTGADGTTLNYTWNYALRLPSIATVQDAAGDRRYYVHQPDGTLLYSIEAADNTRHFYHFDETGTTLFLTDDSGAVTDSYGVTPYGESVTAGANNAMENPFIWQGAYGVMTEPATGLYYMRARWYDSASARFLTRDPIRTVGPRSINPYQFALGNPQMFIDPTGLNPAQTPPSPTPVWIAVHSDGYGGFEPPGIGLADPINPDPDPGPEDLIVGCFSLLRSLPSEGLDLFKEKFEPFCQVKVSRFGEGGREDIYK